MIYKRGKRWRVIVYAGRDPITGRKRQKSQQVPGRPSLDARGQAGRGPAHHRGRRWPAPRHGQPDRRRAAGALAGVATERPAHLAHHGLPPTAATSTAPSCPALGKLPVRRLDAATLDAFYAHLRKPGGKGGRPMAASSVHRGPCHPLGRAQPGGGVGLDRHNPARLATPPSIERTDLQPPAVEDAARLLAVALAEDPELGLFLRLAVVLGARRGELCALRWSDVDLDQGEVLIAGRIVRVPGESLVDKATKTHAKRRVALGADTVELLRAHRLAQAKNALAFGTTLAPDAYVFSHVPDGSTPINPDGITHRFRRLARRLGVRCRLHDLRHFMVTQLVAGGVDWRTVAGRAGHADGHMTLSTYAHFQQAQDRQAAEFMDRLLAAPGTNSR